MVRISDKDLKLISAQLERFPKNVLEVSQRCSYGFPVVIKSKPILEGKPFPTIYWLSCPFLRYKISQLETEGYIPKYEKLLASSPRLLSLQVRAHLRAQKEAIELAGEKGWIRERLSSGGMGGISNFSHIECLHLHVAYHLGGIENPVGKMVLEEIGKKECENALCKKYESY